MTPIRRYRRRRVRILTPTGESVLAFLAVLAAGACGYGRQLLVDWLS